MCDNIIIENGEILMFIPDCQKDKICRVMLMIILKKCYHALESFPDCYKTQKMCNKAVSTVPSAIQFVPDRFKSQETCDKAVDTGSFTFDFVPDQHITPEL